jgi:salicylate hydroxylase
MYSSSHSMSADVEGTKSPCSWKNALAPDQYFWISFNGSMTLSPNATKVLHALGLKEPLRSRCSLPQAQLQRTSQSGFLLSQRPLGQFADERYGAPHCLVSQTDLLTILLNACETRGVTLTDGRACTEVWQANNNVTIGFNGEQKTHDVLIGCDGHGSTVRSYLGYPPAAVQPGTMIWRGRTSTQPLSGPLTNNAITSWLGSDQYLRHWPHPDGNSVEFLAFVSQPSSDLIPSFSGWHPQLRVLIEASDSLRCEPVLEHEPISQWYDRRVVLLGDACHTLPPHLQQGAALAMEDAWVLSRMLERWEDDPATGFEEYQRFRKVRITRVRRTTREQATQWAPQSSRAALARNLKLSLASRFLPEIAMQQLDWLYGHDCIKGFE